jgi:hypothetical protein
MCNNTNLSSQVNFQSPSQALFQCEKTMLRIDRHYSHVFHYSLEMGHALSVPLGHGIKSSPKSSADHECRFAKNSKILSTLCLSGVSWFAGRALWCMKSGSRTAANLETLYNPIPPPVIYNKTCVTLWPCHLLFFKR